SARATPAATTTVAPSATATPTAAWCQSTVVAAPAIEAGFCSRAVPRLHAPDGHACCAIPFSARPRADERQRGGGQSPPLLDSLHQRALPVGLGLAAL